MTGDELIWALEERGLDMAQARVTSMLMPEPDGEGGWVTPAKEEWKEYLQVEGAEIAEDGTITGGTWTRRRGSVRGDQFDERPFLNLPRCYVTIGGWWIGPGGYRKKQDFSGPLGVTKPRMVEEWHAEDVDELAEILRERLAD